MKTMRALTVQIQPDRSAGIDMARVVEFFETLAADKQLVAKRRFSSDEEEGAYFNYLLETKEIHGLWLFIRQRIFSDDELGRHLSRSVIVVCTGENGWDDYLLLFHFDPRAQLDDFPAAWQAPGSKYL